MAHVAFSEVDVKPFFGLGRIPSARPLRGDDDDFAILEELFVIPPPNQTDKDLKVLGVHRVHQSPPESVEQPGPSGFQPRHSGRKRKADEPLPSLEVERFPSSL